METKAENKMVDVFTIVMLYPDYIANQYGETFTTFVEAEDMDAAIALAQQEAVEAQEREGDDDPIDPEDFAPVFCCRGRCDNIFPE